MEIKKEYSKRIRNKSQFASLSEVFYSDRLFKTYNDIARLKGEGVDLGSGDGSFGKVCRYNNISSIPFDYPMTDFETDYLSVKSNIIDFVTMNAVIEHINNPNNIFNEIRRILKDGGFLFIRTPNWKLDYKNFYNDPTHVKPYSADTLRSLLELFGFEVIHLEPGLILKSDLYYRIPFKWKIASMIKGGTKSIIAVGKLHKK